MPKILIKRGLKANLPVLDMGEIAFCTDTRELFIGTISGNVLANNTILSRDSSLPTSGKYLLNDIIYNSHPMPGGYVGWICVSSGELCGTTWSANTNYSVGQKVSNGGRVYLCKIAGISSTVNPPTSNESNINDGTVSWEYVDKLALFYQFGLISLSPADFVSPTITLSPSPGTYNSTQTVILTADEAVTIYYTTDGTDPTLSSSVYSGGISISTTKTLKFFGKDSSGNVGTTQTATYNIIQSVPNQITNLRLSNVTDQSVMLTWDNSLTATSYDILLDGNLLSNTTNNYYNVINLTQETTYTVTVKAKNSVGSSIGTDIVITTSKTATDDYIFNLDFQNRFGTASNTINDTVNNVACTLYNVTHNGTTSGYINNEGLLLPTNAYVGIPSHLGALYNSINLNSTGLTLELRASNAVGIMVRTNPSNFKIAVGPLVSNNTARYISSVDGTAKNGGWSFSAFKDIETQSSYNTVTPALYPTSELNIITFRIYPSGESELFINGKKSTTKSAITNFSQYADMFAAGELFIRRDEVATNTAPTTLKGFSMYNRVLSDQEILQRCKHFKEIEPLKSVSIYPSPANVGVGETQMLAVVTAPLRYVNLVSNTFESGNAGFVTVDQNGLLAGLIGGETNVGVTTTYQGQTFTNQVNVTIGNSTITPPTSSRTITGISINRKTNSIEVGQSFSAMATTLPFDVFNDNLVTWETSNPAVCRVGLGVLDGVSPGTATITAYDSTKTYSESFIVTVTNPIAVTITAGETYNVVLSNHGIKSDNTDAINTTNGIQSAMDYAVANGYKKLVFPFGTYLITPMARTINLPSNMVIDFSNSTINIEPSVKTTTTGYTMFFMNAVTNTKFMNAKIYGEADSTTVAASTEKCLTMIIEDAYNSGLENCTLSKSPGFNISTSLKLVRTGTTGTSISKNNFEPGTIDANGVNDNSITDSVFRSINYLNISGLGSYYMIGYGQGYFGYNYLRSRLYSIFFYDVNHTFIGSQMNNLQFYNYDKPANAKYAKIVIYQQAAPTVEDTDFSAIAFIRTVGMPIKCYLKGCTFEDNFSTGLAMCGGQGWLLEGNTFSRNKGRMPGCDIDWEDGWDTAVGDIVRKNTFNSTVGVIMTSGCSMAVYDNTFNRSNITMWGRSQNWRIYNNYFNGKEASNVSLSTQAESYFVRNILSGITYTKSINHAGASYSITDTNNTQI